MVQYYTLAQAAEILRISPEQLKAMAQRKEIRAFQDRSGWRFRAQEIDEMARARGFGSDPELPLGEAAGTVNEVFNFNLDAGESEEVPIGKEPGRSGVRSGSGSRKPGSSPKSPPKAASDSDVRLVLDGSDVDFAIDVDSKSKAPASKAPVSPRPKVGSSSKSKSRLAGPVEDSGVRIVPLDQPTDSNVQVPKASPHDSDVPVSEKRTGRPSDSDIRIEEMTGGRVHDQMVTEEIDLDAEQRKADSAAKAKGGRQRPKQPKQPGGTPALPTSSPFELSENEINVDSPAAPPAKEAEDDTDSSSDFELKPMGDSSPVFDSDELQVMRGDDEVGLGEITGAKGGSGINLQDPADSGISLEQEGSDEIDFELSLDAGNTPKPAEAKSTGGDSSSEFELSLSEDESSPTDQSSSSEFELSLDSESGELAVDEGSSDLAEDAAGSDSDSEFELTLDESGGLSAAEEGAEASGEDIFETDFEVPALDEESGSEAVALDEADTDLESSEFDLSLEGESESGSQVVPLEDEEEADEGAATVQRRAVGAVGEDEEELEDIGEALDEDLDEEPVMEDEEREPVAAAAAAPAPPAEWGAMPALVMLPCTIILFLVGLMSFELIQGMWGYHRGAKVSNLLIHPIAKMVSGEDKLPGD